MRLNQFFREFAYSQQGNVAMIFAFSLLPLLMFVGVGIDMAQASAVGRKNQDALDAAILAVFSRPLPETADERLAALARTYTANGGRGSVSILTDAVTSGNATTMEVSAQYDMPTNIMGAIGVGQIPIKIRSGVSRKARLEEVQFKLDRVLGWFDKRVSLYGRAVGSTAYVELMQIDYRWTGTPAQPNYNRTTIKSRVNGVLTEVAVVNCTPSNPSLAVNQQVLVCTNPGASATVDLKNLDDIYLQMTVSALNPAATGMFARYPTLAKTVVTNQATDSQRMFIDGVQQPRTKPIDIQGKIPCGQWSKQDWEDGGSYPEGGPYTGALSVDNTDFKYLVQGACGYSSDPTVRLIR